MKVAIIGGGLVGSLSACYFGNRGHQVDLFEYREDIRCAQHAKGRSINLALSTRGRCALREVGLEDALLQHAIPMKGRMIHQLNSARYPLLYDPKSQQCIYSVSRRFLNEVLLNAAEKYDNVNLHFEYKLLDANMRKGDLTLIRESSNETLKHTADLVVGADGAFSTVRRVLMRQPLFNFSQTYIEHGYLELCIPPTEDNDFAMEPNYLHIWPRGTFMMIALPNQDRSWTVTLFMPFANFKKLDSPAKLVEFFMGEFPDAVPLIGKERLVSDFFAAKASALVSIKCNPYHFEDKLVVIGDAAHAMVPFYGQGMNAGFEDCQILDKIIHSHMLNLSEALKSYSSMRNIDAEAICDLAMYNYMEMRDLVNKPSFLLRKQLDNLLFWMLPNIWVPLYFSVTFTSMRYHICWDNKKWQEKVIKQIFVGIWTVGLAAVLTAIFLWWPLFG